MMKQIGLLKTTIAILLFLLMCLFGVNFIGCSSSSSDPFTYFSGNEEDPPLASISFPGHSALTTATELTISGTAYDESIIWNVEVGGYQAYSTDEYSNWSVSNYSLSNGINSIVVRAEDIFGNVDENADTSTITVVNDISSLTFGQGTDFWRPFSLAVEASGYILVADSPLQQIIRVDPNTGNRIILSDNTKSGPPFGYPGSILADNNNQIIVVDWNITDSDTVFRIDPNTGDRTVVTDVNTGSGEFFDNVDDISFDTNGNLLLVSDDTDAVHRLNLLTGDRSIISSDSIGVGPDLIDPFGVAVNSTGRIFVACFDSSINPSVIFLEIDPISGDRHLISDNSFPGPDIISKGDICIDANNRIIVLQSNGVYGIDPTTGVKSEISGPNVYGASYGLNFGNLMGIAIEKSGMIVAADPYDDIGINADETIWRIYPETGDRVVISKN